MDEATKILKIDATLPQKQCQRCGYAACLPYAEAIARGEADINRCPPGGAAVVLALAKLLGMAARPLDPTCEQGLLDGVAVVDERYCIGCTRCIQACPVDAILGAAKQLHTVIGSECTGCELCLEPCPVDCIHMVKAYGEPWTSPATKGREQDRADRARRRYMLRAARLTREPAHTGGSAPDKAVADKLAKQAFVRAAVARVRARRASAHVTGDGNSPD